MRSCLIIWPSIIQLFFGAPITFTRHSRVCDHTRAVQHALETVAAERTTLVIAHRLSSVLNADQIAVLEGGRLVEIGPPAELREREGGAFAQLLQAQELRP